MNGATSAPGWSAHEAARTSPARASDSVRVVYVMGGARSGSTILDILLGNHPQIESVGELVNLPSRGRELNEYCACGQPVLECEFWNSVWQEWVGAIGELGAATYVQSQQRFLRLRRWPTVTRQLQQPTAGLMSFIGHTEALYRAIAMVSGKSLIVDSSKRPMMGLLLSACPGIDLRLIHIVRDGRGVAWSLKKQIAGSAREGVARPVPSRSSLRAARSWITANCASELVCRRLPSSQWCRLRYEDLMTQPQESLARLADTIAVDLTPLTDRVHDGADLEVGHNVAGNRVRMAGTVRLRGIDEEWIHRLSGREKLLYRTLAAPLLRRYGYAPDPQADVAKASL